MNIAKVISGGQTGVDRAALDAALACGLAIGGWVPKGRKAEDGRISDKYPLIEMATTDYPARTRKNIEDSDATLIIVGSWPISPGTELTMDTARVMKKDSFTISHAALKHEQSLINAREWLKGVKILNVAGPRESKSPGIYKAAYDFLIQVFGENK